MKSLIYLASPYSHPDPAIREARFQAACRACHWLMENGLYVFSPIVHSHPIALLGLPGDWEFWRGYDEMMLSKCDCLDVLVIDGWKESKGMKAEIELARVLGKKINMLEVA